MDPELYKAATSGSIDLLTKKDPSFFLQETEEKNSALHVAVKFKQKQFAEKIIDLHPQLLYQANSIGDTPLHIAATVGCLVIAEVIGNHLNSESREVEENKELLRMVNREKDTALHNAVRNEHLDIVKWMIKKDPGLAGFINANEDSPLFLAVDRKLFEIASHILNGAPECSYQGRNKMNALHAAIIRHNLKSIFSSLSPLKSAFSDLDGIRINPFVVYYRYIRFVINIYKNLLVTRGSRSNGLLEEMIGFNSGLVFMKQFIEQFPDAINESDEFGWTPLHYAAFVGNIVSVSLLLEKDKNQMPHLVYQKDNEGLSALLIAAKEGHVICMSQLIEFYPDTCELVDKRGRTALHVAVENGMVDTVKYVLRTPSLEGLINVKDKEGNTSLHLAAIHGHYEIVKNLLDDTRVDKKAMNKEGFTAIKIIVSKIELTDIEKFQIATKLLWAGGLPSLEGVLRRENAENQNVEMKEKPQIESKKEPANDKEIEGKEEPMKGTIVTKRKPAENKELIKFNHKEIASTHILVATIIATVTFAAGFTMPGGYKSDGPDEGMANFSRKTAFKSFLISDTIAFCFSVTSMCFHFLASMERNSHNFMFFIKWAARLTYISLFAMVIAFISGTNVVLAGSSGLAIANIALGCCFFLLCNLMIFAS